MGNTEYPNMTEQREPTAEEIHKALFANLVMSLASTAMQHLGKLANPATGKTGMNLEAARDVIDMIDMLEAKTRGNRDPEEEAFLKNTLGTLQLTFVDTAESASSAPKAEPTPSGPTPESRTETPPPPKGGEDEGKSRFHKSYG
jgi:hypothetical protein